MRYYIATRLENHRQHNELRDMLKERGHSITYDWTSHGPVWRDGLEVIRDVSLRETQGVLDSDVVIVLIPPGPVGGRGTHAELGIAIGSGKRIVIQHNDATLFGASPETCAFYHHPLVTPVVTISMAEVATAALSALIQREG